MRGKNNLKDHLSHSDKNSIHQVGVQTAFHWYTIKIFFVTIWMKNCIICNYYYCVVYNNINLSENKIIELRWQGKQQYLQVLKECEVTYFKGCVKMQSGNCFLFLMTKFKNLWVISECRTAFTAYIHKFWRKNLY